MSVVPPPGVAVAVTVMASVFVGDAGVIVALPTVVGVPTLITKLELVMKMPSVTLSVMVDAPF